MLDVKRHSTIAESTADMMRACALATARAAGTSMVLGMAFWTQMLQASAAAPPPAAWATCTGGGLSKAVDDTDDKVPPQGPAEAPADSPFSSYRSSGGHAVAQVIISD